MLIYKSVNINAYFNIDVYFEFTFLWILKIKPNLFALLSFSLLTNP